MQSAGARVLPVNKDGKLDGLRLIGVKPGGLANSLGLANSDVLQGVNNTKIESANTLLELYAQLDKLDTVSLDGTRRGKPLKLTLRLR
jgi:type II secretory pathway component PulC